jgi:hypothetical protein
MCNLGAVLCRRFGRLGLIVCAIFLPIVASAQQPATDLPAQPRDNTAVETLKFLSGGALAFVTHESGHLLFDAAFNGHAQLEEVHFGRVPFFAITHRPDLSPRREFAVSSAGFWTQEATSEWLLTKHPDLRHEHAPFAKGVLAFDVLTSAGYAIVAFAKAGPFERDTRGMASSIGIDERAIGAMVLAPAVLDAYRYLKPHERWAVWASRAAKAGRVLLILK